MIRRGLLAALAAACLALPLAAAAGELRALVGGVLLDGSGGPALPDSVILIDGDRIMAVGQIGTLPVPPLAEVISTEGMTVLPGLWDLDVHLSRLGHADGARWDESYVPIAERVVMPAAAHQLLLAGVTSARDVASPLEAAISVRERIRTQRIPGPTLYVSGPVLEKDAPPRTHDYRWNINGPVETKQKVERLVRAGVDFIVAGAANEWTEAEIAALGTAARDAGVPWYADVRHDADIAPALAHGARGLIGLGPDLAPELPEPVAAALRAGAARDLPVAWTTAVSALTNHEWLLRNPEPLDDVRWRDGLPPIIADDVRGSLRNLATLNLYETPALRRAVLGERLRSARAAGARLLVGSGAGLPAHIHSRATWQEVEALVLEAGLTSVEAIRAATLDAAIAMGEEHENGSVSPGKYADIIAVRGDVARHIERLADVEIVIRHGSRYR